MAEEAPLFPEQRKEHSLGYTNFKQRLTPELIFVFVEPIGGGAQQAATALIRILMNETFKYEINEISLSKIIAEEASKHGLQEPNTHKLLSGITPLSEEAKRINRLQQQGNALRQKNGSDFLAKKAIQKISSYRMQHGGLEQVDSAAPVPKPLRVAHVIRSIKHKAELDLLKAVYGDLLLLVAVSGKFDQQVFNYRPKESTKAANDLIEKEYRALATIDQDEGIEHGQQVREIFYKANLFLGNDEGKVEKRITAFLDLLFGNTICSPTIDERMMFEAFAASLRSTCLSRQVGAAICDDNNDLVSIGWNDIPAFGGGLATDANPDQAKSLCKSIGTCRTNEEIKKLIGNIFKKLADNRALKKGTDLDRFTEISRTAGLSNLIEFSRAIHAEMEAILSAARTGKIGLKNGTLYVTTYPCENCVKHILTSGIKRVVYIEPYPKSRAKAFFSDFIADEEDSEDINNKLVFSQFTGISPQSYSLLFKMAMPRKRKDGTCFNRKPNPMPLTNVYVDSYTLYEAKIASEIDHG